MSQFHIYWFSLPFLPNHSGEPGVTRQLSKIKKKYWKKILQRKQVKKNLSLIVPADQTLKVEDHDEDRCDMAESSGGQRRKLCQS
jgi:hypothetical protein